MNGMSTGSHGDGLSRRSFVGGALSAAFANKLSAQAWNGNLGKSTRPNIVYIHSHDSGRYLKPYGNNVPTPRLDRLAHEGILFRKAFSGAPTCSPSRAALLTGQSAHRSGMLGLAHLGWSLNDYKQHLLHTLRPHGYSSTLVGMQHIAAKPEVIGYDTILPAATMSAKDVAPAAVGFLKPRPAVPFFLDVGFFETHRKYPDPVDNPDYILPPATLPDTPEVRRDMAGFHASARVLDRGVGQVLDALEEYGFAKNTLVISTTDHGIAFPEMKCDLNDSGWGVSLIMRGPGAFKTPTVCDALLSHIDLFPTLCEYLAIDKPAWLEGKSFLPVLTGVQAEIRDEVFAEVTYHAAYEPKRAVRTHRWKYIKRFDGRHTPVLPNCDDGGSKAYWIANGWRTNPLEHDEELYDLVFDPTERNNLADAPEHGETLREMQDRLQRWMVATQDPLLHGPVSLPAGGRAVDPNALSPAELNRPPRA